MVKKGKYRLFSYLLENHLIYYKSLKLTNKLIAFALVEYSNFKSVEPILDALLRNRVIKYYSIQIEINEKREKILLLNFEDYQKENIIKAFNNVRQNLAEIEKPVKFLKEKILEKKFFAIFFQDINSNTSITKTTEVLTISGENKQKSFDFFSIDLNSIKKRNSFIVNFINLVKNLGRRGFLIFNFQIENNDIKISAYFVDIYENIKSSLNYEDKINSFFHCNLIKRQNLKIHSIFSYFWRLGISNTYFFLNDFYELFFPPKDTYSQELFDTNNQIEKNLLSNKIEYLRLSTNLLLIENNYLFIILENLNSQYIHRILRDHYPKYFIYILILDELGYRKLLKMNSIKLIESIKVVHPEEIQKFNFQEFKRIILLKDP